MIRQPIPDAALDDRLGFLGTSGSGKTYNAGVAIERLLSKKARVVIVDPLGVWWGLRLLADGKKASNFNVVIFGGPRGDLPLTEHAGALIGETAATMAESCIVDLRELGSKSAERRFMTAFLENLYRKASGEPFHLIVDEADLFAPQKPAGGDETLLGHMENIVRRGRVKGFIPWLISQRPAVLNKNVLSQVDGLVAFKLTASQDRDALDSWIEGQADKADAKAIKDALPAMEVGQGVIWLPGRGVLTTARFPQKVTFDSSRTPKRGEKVKRTAALKPIDLGAVKGKLATVEAETKANDPKVLRAEVIKLKAATAALERQLTLKSTATAAPAKPDKDAIAAAEQRGFDQAKKKLWREAEKHAAETICAAMDGLDALIGPIAVALKERLGATRKQRIGLQNAIEFTAPAPTAVPRAVSSGSPLSPSRAKPSAPNAVLRQPAPAGDGTLTNPQRELLRSLAWWSAMGHEQPTRTQAAAIAGWKPKGSNLRNRLAELSTAALVVYPRDGLVQLTEAGHAAAPAPDMSATLVDSVRGICTGPMLTVFDALVAFRDEEGITVVDRADLAARVGWEPGGSNLRNRLAELSAIEAVEYPGKGSVSLQEWVNDQQRAAA